MGLLRRAMNSPIAKYAGAAALALASFVGVRELVLALKPPYKPPGA